MNFRLLCVCNAACYNYQCSKGPSHPFMPVFLPTLPLWSRNPPFACSIPLVNTYRAQWCKLESISQSSLQAISDKNQEMFPMSLSSVRILLSCVLSLPEGLVIKSSANLSPFLNSLYSAVILEIYYWDKDCAWLFFFFFESVSGRT